MRRNSCNIVGRSLSTIVLDQVYNRSSYRVPTTRQKGPQIRQDPTFRSAGCRVGGSCPATLCNGRGRRERLPALPDTNRTRSDTGISLRSCRQGRSGYTSGLRLDKSRVLLPGRGHRQRSCRYKGCGRQTRRSHLESAILTARLRSLRGSRKRRRPAGPPRSAGPFTCPEVCLPELSTAN